MEVQSRRLPLVLALLWSSDKEPVVNIAKRVWHEGLCFIMTPLAINNELVLVIAASVHKDLLLCIRQLLVSMCTGLADQCLKCTAYPGGRCTTTANTPGFDSSDAIGTVSTHRVKDPHRWTYNARMSSSKARVMCRRQERHAHHLTAELPCETCWHKVGGHARSSNTSCATTMSRISPAQLVSSGR